jgi:uncharacterized membrane protein YeaQ/YmgE (transglycosylase-associated protein family)
LNNTLYSNLYPFTGNLHFRVLSWRKQSKFEEKRDMGTLISTLVLGLVAGALAKLIYPGTQGGGIIATILLGVIGAFVGGQIAALLGFAQAQLVPQLIAAVIGSMILIFLWGLIFRKA